MFRIGCQVSSQCVCRSPYLKMADNIAAQLVACQQTALLPRQQARPCKLRVRQSPYNRSHCDHVLATSQQHSVAGSKSIVPSRTVPILSGQTVKRRITCSVSAQQRQVCSAQHIVGLLQRSLFDLFVCRIQYSRLGHSRRRQQSCLVMHY